MPSLRPAWLAGVATVFVAATVFAVLLAGCHSPFPMHGNRHHHDRGADTRDDAQVAAADAITIEITGYAFRPGNVVVKPGTTVTWLNRDGVAHTATASSGAFDTGLLSEGEQATIQLDEPGIYEYICLPHPSMKARIEVRPDA